MTELQALHHLEQMEALRRDFMRDWQQHWAAVFAHFTVRDRAAVQQLMWNDWRKGKLFW